jgi:hypothetical protein
MYAAAAEVAILQAGGVRAVLAAAGVDLSHLELPQQPHSTEPQPQGASAAEEEQAKAAPSCSGTGTVGDSGGAAASEPSLIASPNWNWGPENCLLLQLSDYELVAQLLTGARPPLLGRGGGIPPGTLAAFR